MERQDGKDPFDAKTYTVPATTMMTMVELRVFCVDFVERHIRVNTSALEDELMGPFINLITHSNGLFSRARAVIPELQIPQEEGSSSHPNPNVQRLLQATRDWRGPAHKKWDDLAEEPFWAKLARDQKAANDKKEHKKQSSVSSLDRFGRMNIKGEELAKAKAEPVGFPDFVPQSAMGDQQLVWSPTSGTRPRRPDEKYTSPAASPATMSMRFGTEIARGSPSPDKLTSSPPKRSASSVPSYPSTSPSKLGHASQAAETPFDSNQATSLRLRGGRVPLGQSVSYGPGSAPLPARVDQLIEDAKKKPEFMATPWDPEFSAGSRRMSIGHALSIGNADSTSAPASITGFGDVALTGHGSYGEPTIPYQPYEVEDSFLPTDDPNAFAPSPAIWSPHHSTFSTGDTNMPQVSPTLSSDETLFIPPQGSMSPLDYWNMLYQRENDIISRLKKAHKPMTDHQHQYVAALGEARVQTAATQMPARGSMSKKKWLAELDRTLNSIWKLQPGQMPWSPLVVARKQDFEKAVRIAIDMANMGPSFL